MTIIANFKDHSLLLMSLFVAFFLYFSLTGLDVLPKLYSDDFPQAYFDLVNKAETGGEIPVNGKYRHEEFKAMYDAFVNRIK